MRIAVAVAAVVVPLLSSVAAAQSAPADAPATTRTTAAEPDATIAFAVNPPMRWSTAVAGSLSVGFAQHHAIRANVASYEYTGNVAGDLIGVAAGGDGDEGSYDGSTFDVGIGYQYFPGRLFDGLSLEVGLLRRAVDHHVVDEFASRPDLQTTATGYGVRALVGWSWMYSDWLFVAAAVGVSGGDYRGTERTTDLLDNRMVETTRFSRAEWAAEGYLRIGLAFGVGP